jgi:hypothetical protein
MCKRPRKQTVKQLLGNLRIKLTGLATVERISDGKNALFIPLPRVINFVKSRQTRPIL